MSLITQRRVEYRRSSPGVNRHGTIAGFLGCIPFSVAKNAHRCHSERSEESLSGLGCFASLSMTLKQLRRHLFGDAPGFLPFLWGVGLLCGGCASIPEAGRTDFWIAARYDVEPKLIEGGLSPNENAIRNDFKAIAELGFGGVVLHHVEDGDRRTLLDLAAEAGLKAAVPDRKFDRFVVTGRLPPSCREEDDLFREAPDEVIRHPAFNGYVVEDGRGPAARERSRKLRAQLTRRGAIGSLPGVYDDAPPAIIHAEAVRQDPPGTAIERLLAEYHTALSEGRTGGVIVDRFARLPGDPPGLTSPDDPLLPAYSSAVAALIQRARCWGPRLNGLPAAALDIEETKSSSLAVTALSRDARRYLLLFNTSKDRFARSEVRLPATILDRTVLRAVEVPPSTDRGAGRVIHSQHGQLIFPIELRPGDAMLFELFASPR